MTSYIETGAVRIGEGGADDTREALTVIPNTAAVHTPASFPQPERGSKRYQNNAPLSDTTKSAAGPMRSSAVQKAEAITAAILMHAAQTGVTSLAVAVDGARLCDLLGWDRESKNLRLRVWKSTRYAERLGLIAILDPGRPRPGKDVEGRCTLYSVIRERSNPGDLRLTDAEVEAQRTAVLLDLRSNWRIWNRIRDHFAALAEFDRSLPSVKKRLANEHAEAKFASLLAEEIGKA